MTWQQTLHEGAFTARNFLFADGRQIDLRLAYRTIAVRCRPYRAEAGPRRRCPDQNKRAHASRRCERNMLCDGSAIGGTTDVCPFDAEPVEERQRIGRHLRETGCQRSTAGLAVAPQIMSDGPHAVCEFACDWLPKPAIEPQRMCKRKKPTTLQGSRLTPAYRRCSTAYTSSRHRHSYFGFCVIASPRSVPAYSDAVSGGMPGAFEK
jgi:hypothetical protein